MGAHEDTVALLRRLLPSATGVCVPRADKLGLLRSGELDAAQIYDCTEAVTLERELRAVNASDDNDAAAPAQLAELVRGRMQRCHTGLRRSYPELDQCGRRGGESGSGSDAAAGKAKSQ